LRISIPADFQRQGGLADLPRADYGHGRLPPQGLLDAAGMRAALSSLHIKRLTLEIQV
jgi:hypothetical protein